MYLLYTEIMGAILGAIIYLFFGLLELLLGLRFVFELFGANPVSPVVAWVYTNSWQFVAPFFGIFPQVSPTVGAVVHSVFDPATLVALLVYGAIGAIVARFLGFGRRDVV